MKITLDIPDTVVCVFFNYVTYKESDYGVMDMYSHGIEPNKLHDGAVIKLNAVSKED